MRQDRREDPPEEVPWTPLFEPPPLWVTITFWVVVIVLSPIWLLLWAIYELRDHWVAARWGLGRR